MALHMLTTPNYPNFYILPRLSYLLSILETLNFLHGLDIASPSLWMMGVARRVALFKYWGPQSYLRMAETWVVKFCVPVATYIVLPTRWHLSLSFRLEIPRVRGQPTRWHIIPKMGVVMVTRPILNFESSCNISEMDKARDFKFCTLVDK